jgi:hypothetical protein
MGEGRELLADCLAIFESLAREVEACWHLDSDEHGQSICSRLREHLDSPASKPVAQRLYDSEINCEISSFWDGGFTVKIGDEMNGFRAEVCVDTFSEAEDWLAREAARLYHNSRFVAPTPAEGGA